MDPGKNGRELYSRAELYDIAYDWDVTRELHFFVACMELFGPGEATSILEPACGTGRNLEALARMGLRCTGYDLSPEALAYATARLENEGLSALATVHQGDMASFHCDERFDGAFNSINSFRYLLDDEEIQAHLAAVRDMLVPTGVYVIDASYAMPSRQKPKLYRWDASRGDLHVEVTWTTREDRPARRSHETCTLLVSGPRGDETIVTRHSTRLWLQEDFARQVHEAGFSLEAIHDGEFREVPAGKRLHGGMDNLYHVLKKR